MQDALGAFQEPLKVLLDLLSRSVSSRLSRRRRGYSGAI